MEVSVGYAVEFDFDPPVVRRELIETLAAESGLPLKKCFRLLRNSFGDLDVAREWVEKDKVIYEGSRKRSAEVRRVLRVKQARWASIESIEFGNGSSIKYAPIACEDFEVINGPPDVGSTVYVTAQMSDGVTPKCKLNADGSWIVDVLFSPAYGNEPRFVPCRVDKHGVWRVVGGNYIVAPRRDELGRLNGSL